MCPAIIGRFQISTISGSRLRCLQLYRWYSKKCCRFVRHTVWVHCAHQQKDNFINNRTVVRSERMMQQSFFIFHVKMSVNKDLSKRKVFRWRSFLIYFLERRISKMATTELNRQAAGPDSVLESNNGEAIAIKKINSKCRMP